MSSCDHIGLVQSSCSVKVATFLPAVALHTCSAAKRAVSSYDQTKLEMEEDYTDRTGGSTAFVALRGDAGKETFKNWTYKLRLEGDLSDANMLYASVATGVLPGDIQVISPAPSVLEVTKLSAETLTSFEVGSKNRFLDERLQVNGAAFYYRYGAFQRPGTVIRVAPSIAFGNLTAGARMWVPSLKQCTDPLGPIV